MRVNAVVGVNLPEVVTLYVSGDVDEQDTSELCDLIVGNGCPATPTVALDLSEVTFFGSGGIRALIRASKLLQARDCRLCIDDCSGFVQRVLDVTGVRAAFSRSDVVVPLDDEGAA